MARKYEIVRTVTVLQFHATILDPITRQFEDRCFICYDPIKTKEAAKKFIDRRLFYDEVLISIDSVDEITIPYGTSKEDFIKVATPIADPVINPYTLE